MVIETIKIYAYQFPLNPTLKLSTGEISERRGLILHLFSEGVEGFGEIAPLEGFSKETLAECLQQINKVKHFLIGEPPPKNLEYLNGAFEKWLGNLQLLPAVRCGIEMAMLNLISQKRKTPLFQLLSANHHAQVRVNALLQGDLNELPDQARQAVQEGFTFLKLKVGQNFDEDIQKVRAINEAIEGQAILHLDANRSWDIKEAIEFGNTIGCAAVDYIEEPLKNIDDIPQFYYETTIPVALDETITEKTIEDIKKIEGVDAVVLKPTILGGFERTWNIIEEAKIQAILPVISSTFESAIGILSLAQLVGGRARDRAAGLDTLKWFENNSLKNSNLIIDGKIDVSVLEVNPETINFDLLTEITNNS